VVKDARICFGGMAGTPLRAIRCEAFLRNKRWNEATASGAQEVLRACYEPLSDWRATARYRSQVAGNLLRKYFLETTTQHPIHLAGRGERTLYEA
jgi:xanthine dehydrogenase small subunit